jgi:hypothetical protein
MAQHIGDAVAPLSAVEATEAIQLLQIRVQSTDARLKRVEEAGKVFGDTQRLMDENLDGIYKMMTQWNSSSEMGSGQRPQRHTTSPTPPLTPQTMLNAEDLAILKKQEAQSKITIHLDPFYSSSQPNTEASSSTMFAPLDPHTYTPSGFVYT